MKPREVLLIPCIGGLVSRKGVFLLLQHLSQNQACFSGKDKACCGQRYTSIHLVDVDGLSISVLAKRQNIDLISLGKIYSDSQVYSWNEGNVQEVLLPNVNKINLPLLCPRYSLKIFSDVPMYEPGISLPLLESPEV